MNLFRRFGGNILLLLIIFLLLKNNECLATSTDHWQRSNRILNPDDSSQLIQSLTAFMQYADSGRYKDILPFYDPDFVSVRVVDAGQFIKMDYRQMMDFWNAQMARQGAAAGFNHRAIVNFTTTIHYVELLGDTAHVLMTRIKDMGNGPEPMFYDLTWIKKNNHWLLFREIVHQRTLPSFH